MQLIRTILIILLIYYGFKFITRLIAPILLKKMVNKMGDNFQNSFNNYSHQYNQQEGKVTVEKRKRKDENLKSGKNVGDYVDFEEIDD